MDAAVSDVGPAALTLTTNDGGANGYLSFSGRGSIGFLATSNLLTINGQAYTLLNSLPSLSSAIAQNPAGRFALASEYKLANELDLA